MRGFKTEKRNRVLEQSPEHSVILLAVLFLSCAMTVCDVLFLMFSKFSPSWKEKLQKEEEDYRLAH